MQKQKQHTRFKASMWNEQLSSATCYWYTLKSSSIVPIGNEYKDISQRPECIHT